MTSTRSFRLEEIDERPKKRELERTIRAAGWRTAMCLRIVAPSLVMTTSP